MNNLEAFDYCPELKTLYENRSTIGRSGKTFDGSGGLSTVNNLMLIRSLMLELKPLRTLEVGMAFGGSAVAFAATHKDLGREPARQHTAVDPAQSHYWDDAGRINLEKAQLNNFVEIIDVCSSAALPRLFQLGLNLKLRGDLISGISNNYHAT